MDRNAHTDPFSTARTGDATKHCPFRGPVLPRSGGPHWRTTLLPSRGQDLADLVLGGGAVSLKLDGAGLEALAFAGIVVQWAVVGETGGLIAVDPGGDVRAGGDDGHAERDKIAGNLPACVLPVVDAAGAVAERLRRIVLQAAV